MTCPWLGRRTGSWKTGNWQVGTESLFSMGSQLAKWEVHFAAIM